jgi:chromosome segregation ATPase
VFTGVEENRNLRSDCERLKECVGRYETEFQNLQKDKRIAEMEIKELRNALMSKENDRDKLIQDQFNTKEKTELITQGQDKRNLELEAQVSSFASQKKEMKEGFTKEIERMINFHKQALDLLKDENRSIDNRYRSELDERKTEIERYKEQERSVTENYKKGLMSSGHPSMRSEGVDSARGNFGYKDFEKIEKDLVLKSHEIIDLNMELDKVQRGKTELEEKFRRENKLRLEISDELGALKGKNRELREKAGRVDFMKEMEKKSETELLKEMNDLREMVEDLKVERDKMIDELRENNLLSTDDLRLREISSENLLSYIKLLIDEKLSLNKSLATNQAQAKEMGHKVSELENLVSMYKNDCERYKDEVSVKNLEQESAFRKFDEQGSELALTKGELSKSRGLMQVELQRFQIECDKAANQNDRLGQQNCGLMAQMKEQSLLNEDSLKVNDMIVQLTKEKFANDLSELQIKFGVITTGKDSVDMRVKLREALLAFLRNSETLIHKNSKIVNQEEKIKKLEGRVKVLKSSKHGLKAKVSEAYAEMEKLSKKAVGMHKNLKDVASMVKESQDQRKDTKKSKKAALTTDDDHKNYSTVQSAPKPPLGKHDSKKIDSIRLEADLLSTNNKFKNAEKNLTFMNEQLSVYKIRISEKDDEIKSLLGENKRLCKEMADAVKGFKNEMNKRPNAFEENKKMLELEDEKLKLQEKVKKLTEFKE